MRIVVTGVGGSVGSRVAQLLVQQPNNHVTGIDRVQHQVVGLSAQVLGDLRFIDLDEVFVGADCVVHLASAFGQNEFVDASAHDTRTARVVLEAAARCSVSHFVLLSSAMVYGARSDNPIPLTEQAPMRPGQLSFAENKATIEQLGADWADESPGRRLSVLRPTTAVAARGSSWVARSMQLAAGLGSDANPHLQFLHLDDLAGAVALLVAVDGEGVYNAAPDGWVRADEVRQLSGRAPRLRLPRSVADQIVRVSWQAGIVATPPGIMPYATESWVVSNDRLRQLGWKPQWSNVEAYVDGYDARPWAMLNAQRRQQLALSGAAAGVGVAAIGARAVARRWSSR